MQALKTFFKKNKDIQKNPEIESTFDHSKISGSDDISSCPFMKNKSANKTEGEKSEKCPYNGKAISNDKKPKNNGKEQAESSSDEDQIPRGGCPMMTGSFKKRNPDLFQSNTGHNEPFVSKFNYYLSSNKIDFTLFKKKNNQSRPISKSREIFNSYPIYLKHTLFFNGEDYKKVREIQCCSRFMPYEKLREKGNKYYNKGQYGLALDYYERALSLFKWLEYCEEDESDRQTMKSDSVSCIQSNMSIESDTASNDQNSKIQINLNPGSEKQIGEKDDELDQMTTKYKEFFVIYTDQNVKLFDGQDMEDKPDVDMRKSLMLQLYLNMAAAYIKLNNYSVAMQCIEDCFGLTDKVSQVYLRKAQIILSNESSSLQDLYEAKRCVENALQMKKSEKIFQSNENILKLVNLHKATESYQQTLNQVEQKIVEKEKKVNQITQKVYKRMKQVHQNEQRIIKEGKVPYEREEQTMFESKEYKILLKMKQKYIKVIEFYTEAKNDEQVGLAKKQMQQLLRVFTEMNMILNVKLVEKDNQLGGIITEKIQRRVKSIKKNFCEDVYNAGRFNFTMMQWAIKQIIKEEQKQEDLKKKAEMQEKKRNGEQIFQQKDDKYGFLRKASWGLVLIPIAGVLINNFLF